jgi:K(+)-stimulated pyrophosphate-energized sodium pump
MQATPSDPAADGFETYGVTGVALISFILLAVHDQGVQVQLLVWIFAMRIMMVIASALSYFINAAIAKSRYLNVEKMNYETPLTTLVWLTSIVSVIITYAASWLLIPELAGDPSLWWKLSTVITCGTLAGALIPELVKVFTSVDSRHVREVVTSSREGGPSLNILSGLVAGNFSAYWLGMAILALMFGGYAVSTLFPANLMIAPAIFAFGLIAFGFLGMGPVTIAVDPTGPSRTMRSRFTNCPPLSRSRVSMQTLRRISDLSHSLRRRRIISKRTMEPGTRSRQRPSPVLIGTAVVGATTMIFSIIVSLTDPQGTGVLDTALVASISPMNPLFLLGLIAGGLRDLLVHRRLHPGCQHRCVPRPSSSSKQISSSREQQERR